jgi:pyridoxal phosphate enzyme (YggS family)
MVGIIDNLSLVRDRIGRAAARAGRQASDITLVAVTKTVPAGAIIEGIAAGITVIGENRVQEARQKYPAIGARTQWHLIGHLQSNKAGKAVELFSLIHSVDSVPLAVELGRRAHSLGKVQDILVEVNTSGEGQKFGIAPGTGTVIKVINDIHEIPGIKVLGLMTVGPLTGDQDRIRQAFRTLKGLFDRVRSEKIPNVEMRHLSMGMSGDFEAAVEEGSTMVRIGSAIFGPRG